MAEHPVVLLCRRYAAADALRDKSRALREVRYAVERASPQPASVEEVGQAWKQLQEEGILGEAEAKALVALCHAYDALRRNVLESACKQLRRALQEAEAMECHEAREHLLCVIQIAQVLARCEARDYGTAIQEAESLRARCEALHLPTLVAELLHVLGLTHRRRGSPDDALEALSAARDRYEMGGDHLGAARVEDTLGMVMLDLGSFEESVFHLQRSFARKTNYGDKGGLAMTSGNIGRLYLQFEEYGKAREFLEQDLALSRELGDEKGQIIAYNELAEAVLGQGEKGEARRLLVEADKLARLSRDPFAQANTFFAKASLCLAEEKFDDALHFHRLAREAFGKEPSPLVSTHLDMQEGMIEAVRYNISRAQECLDRAILSFRSLKQKGWLAKTQFECAMALLRKGSPDEAVAYLVEAIDNARDIAAQRMAERFSSACQQVSTEKWLRTLLEVKRVNQQLREEQAMREANMHFVVHDVRGPLGIISQSVEFATESARAGRGMDDTVIEQLSDAKRQSQWLLELVSSILDVYKLEAGEVFLHPKPVELSPLISELARWVQPAAREGVRVRPAPESEEVHVWADESSVKRILMNFLNNAVKYTIPREEPVDEEGNKGLVSMGVRREGELARVCVQDTGSGIPEEFREKVFAKFGQVEPGMRKHSTGLGLYYCKLAVEAQGGSVGVDSKVGEGSTFWFTLPLA